MARIFLVLGAILALFSVALGAFGAHGLAAHFAAHPDLEATYQTAVQYHQMPALALLILAWAVTRWPGRLLAWAGGAFVAGIVLFSGSLYLLGLGGPGWLGAIAPLGGVALIAGWGLLAAGVWRGR
jgi:uncharacterized membrane protein YgdD (TMEM256/DUF423 family)